MAGEIEEAWVNFQVDSFDCGSISFGRFENEALCWERRSSFSHNRYLEEVEKCLKPGSVTEKKAYFEIHFRKKGLFAPSSLEGQNETDYQTSENDITDKMGINDEETDQINVARFDESLDGSIHGEDHECRELLGASFSEPRFELASDSTNYVDCVPEHGKVDEADDAELGSLLSIIPKWGIDIKGKINGEKTNSDNHTNEKFFYACPKAEQGLSAKEKVRSKPESTKPRSTNPRVAVGQSKRYTSSNVSKGLESKVCKTEECFSKIQSRGEDFTKS